MLNFFSVFVWDPNRNVFVVPGINHAITWYGILFAPGFFIGYYLVKKFFYWHLLSLKKGENEAKSSALKLTDRLALLVILGTIVGARLGHVFFYEWPFYAKNPLAILRIWEGGLASHGGAIGILISLLIFVLWSRKEFPSLTFLAILDLICIPAAIGGGFIRIGNFINQEILGTPTTLPWGVLFLHPIDGAPSVPLHPVQLYESSFYFLIGLILLAVWHFQGKKMGAGLLAGLFFFSIFTFRFFIEFLKLPQSVLIDETEGLKMGQWLSLPFALFGLFLLVLYAWRRVKCKAL